MLDMLDKLITEHGSSAILRERLELFSDKYSALEKQNKHLHENNKVLEYQFDKAKKEIKRLQKILDANNENQKNNVISDI